jgi:hypothetical protein
MLPRGGRLRCLEQRLLNGIAFIHIWKVTVFSVDALHINMLNMWTVKARPIEIDKCTKLSSAFVQTIQCAQGTRCGCIKMKIVLTLKTVEGGFIVKNTTMYVQ